jgi:hypothetical protein
LSHAEEDLVRRDFPALQNDPLFKKTSDADPDYNCIGWAIDDLRWFWPPPAVKAVTRAGRYWPPPEKVRQDETVGAFIELFALAGYTVCDDGRYEEGVEKVAIFTDLSGTPTHAARQLEEGNWTSKLGEEIDIRHARVDGVAGDAYGIPLVFLCRPSGSSPIEDL